MADAIIISILLVCGLLALRSCLRKKGCKGGSCCGSCSGCAPQSKHKQDSH